MALDGIEAVVETLELFPHGLGIQQTDIDPVRQKYEDYQKSDDDQDSECPHKQVPPRKTTTRIKSSFFANYGATVTQGSIPAKSGNP